MTEPDRDRLCRQIVEDTPDAVICADREGVIRLWNRGAVQIFGFAEAEAVGQSLDLIIPPRLRERHWQGYRQVMASGATRYGTELLAVPGLTKDGATISLEFSIVLIKDAQGQVQGAGAILRDVTARWEREKALRQRLAALERCDGATANRQYFVVVFVAAGFRLRKIAFPQPCLQRRLKTAATFA